MKNNYDDIINLPHHTSHKHSPMSMQNRAAQFAPFAALNGHRDAIEETARLTDYQITLDESDTNVLNRKLFYLRSQLSKHPEITITYFIPDNKKSGGAYNIKSGIVNKIDNDKQQIHLSNGTIIPLQSIIGIDGKIFENIE